jgi:hypothetical protein
MFLTSLKTKIVSGEIVKVNWDEPSRVLTCEDKDGKRSSIGLTIVDPKIPGNISSAELNEFLMWYAERGK